jgi:hypothetical protein
LMDREQGGGATGVTAHGFDDIDLQEQRS